MSNQWTLRKEKVSIEVKHLSSIPVINHPLSNNVRSQKKEKFSEKRQPKSQFIDPLSLALDGVDPLYVGVSENHSSHTKLRDKENCSFEVKNSKSWEDICSRYLAKCSTKQRISLAANFPLHAELGTPNFETLCYNKVKGSFQTESERIRLRMEYLASMGEYSNSTRDLTSLTSEQFSEYISYLKSELLNVWNTERRVMALKIAKEAAKSLGLSTPELFYPNKFMLVTDLLLTLGRLVYERLSEIANSQSSINNCMEVKEIARNWFSNVGSTRDLLPRIYLEASLLQCYTFSDISTIGPAFECLLKMTRGLADPLVSAYAKMYVVKAALGGCHMVHVTTGISDMENVLQCGWREQRIEVDNESCSLGKEITEKIFYPPLLWLLQSSVNYGSVSEYQAVFAICSKSDKLAQYLLLKAIFATFPASFVACECIAFKDLLSRCLQKGTHPQELLISFGKIMNLAPPPKECKFQLMSGIWNLLFVIDSLDAFIRACDPWMQFAVQNFEVNDTEKILSNLVKKIKSMCEEQPKSYQSDLLHLLVNILMNAAHSQLLISRPNIHQLLTMLHQDAVGAVVVSKDGKARISLSDLKELLEAVLSNHPSPLKEPALIKILIGLFSSLHDRINALTTTDEKRQISQLLRDFILKIDFGRDFNQQLEFYVSCRESFSNVDSILEILIHQVCKLQMETLLIVKRNHSSKTASFERACTAYCYITIPTMTSSHKRLQLYLLAGSVAMTNSCANQAQACIVRAIKEVSKCVEIFSSRTIPSEVLSTMLCLCSYLIATPCLSDSFLGWFVSITRNIGVTSDEVEFSAKMDVAVFKAMCSSSQKCLPYHFSGVNGNDSIFSHERRHLETADMCNQWISSILSSVTSTNSYGYNCMKTELLCCLLQYGDGMYNTRIISLILKSLTKESDKCYYEKKIRNLLQI